MLESLSLARTSTIALPTKGDAQLRRTRYCYRHLAGKLGVAFCAALLQRDWLQTGTRGLQLQPAGIDALSAHGLQLANLSHVYGRSCLDWTERRMHVDGPLGVAMTSAMFEAGWLRRSTRDRTLIPSADGLRRLSELGVDLK
jgi:hypothetical protein